MGRSISKILHYMQKSNYHTSKVLNCHWRDLLTRIASKEIVINEKPQFLSLKKQVNSDLWKKNEFILKDFHSKKKINDLQHSLLTIDNAKKWRTLDHPGFYYIYKNKLYFICQTTHSGSINAIWSYEQIALASKKTFHEAKEMFFVEIDGKNYYPKAYCLGNLNNLKIYQLEEATTMSKLQIQNFQILSPNYIDLYNKSEFYEDYSNLDFYLESNLLSSLSDGVQKHKNSLLNFDARIKND